MSSRLYTYSLIQALYDQGGDLIDCFWPLALSAFPEEVEDSSERAVFLGSLQASIQHLYGLGIPQHSLQIILNRAKKRGLADKKKDKYWLTFEGVVARSKLEPDRDAQRRTNEVSNALRKALASETGSELSLEEVELLLIGFVHSNIEMFHYFMDSRKKSNRPTLETAGPSREQEIVLRRFFHEVEESKPAMYRVLQDIVCGTVLSAVLFTERLPDFDARFTKTTIFLDSNLLFGVLGLRHESENRPAKELFDFLAETEHLRLCVFDFTIAEMVAVLRGFASEGLRFSPTVKVDSIYCSMRGQGWTPSKVRLLISELEERLSTLGIRVVPTNVDLESFTSESSKVSLLKRLKPKSNLRSRNHDLAAIHYVRQRRMGERPRRIEHCRSLFLTSDLRLVKYNLVEGGHRQQDSIAEVLADRVLTNILWLKNPGKLAELSLTSILSIHAGGMVVGRDVWDRFYNTLAAMKESEELAERDMALLLYDRTLEEVLGQTKKDSIDKNFVWNRLAEARKTSEQEVVDKLAEQQRRFEIEASQLLNEREEDVQGKLEGVRKTLHAKSAKDLVVAKIGAGLLLTTTLILVAWGLKVRVAEHWSVLEPYASLVSACLTLSVAVLSALGLKKYLGVKLAAKEEAFRSWRFDRRARAAGLHKLIIR